MTVSFQTTTSTPSIHPQAKLSHPLPSCATKFYSGLKLQSATSISYPHLRLDFDLWYLRRFFMGSMPNQSRSTSLEQNMAMELYQFCRSEAFRLGRIFQWRDAARPCSDDIIFLRLGVSRGGTHHEGVRVACGGVWIPLTGYRWEYTAIATELKGEHVLLAKVDATEKNKFSQEFNVQGFTTIHFFVDGVHKPPSFRLKRSSSSRTSLLSRCLVLLVH